LGTGELIARWFVAFAITQGVECPVYARGFGVRPATAFGASAITHPIVVFVMPYLWEKLYLMVITARPGLALGADAYFVGYGALAESFAVVVEALYLMRWARLGAKRAAVASLAANTASGVVGLICSALTGWP
jgi:hypothetical protein